MPSIPLNRPADPSLLAFVPALVDAVGGTDQPEAQAYFLIRSWQAGMPRADLLDGAPRDSAKTHGASQDVQRSGHPRPSAPTECLVGFRLRGGLFSNLEIVCDDEKYIGQRPLRFLIPSLPHPQWPR